MLQYDTYSGDVEVVDQKTIDSKMTPGVVYKVTVPVQGVNRTFNAVSAPALFGVLAEAEGWSPAEIQKWITNKLLGYFYRQISIDRDLSLVEEIQVPSGIFLDGFEQMKGKR